MQVEITISGDPHGGRDKIPTRTIIISSSNKTVSDRQHLTSVSNRGQLGAAILVSITIGTTITKEGTIISRTTIITLHLEATTTTVAIGTIITTSSIEWESHPPNSLDSITTIRNKTNGVQVALARV